MRATLDELKRELSELRSFVASITQISDALANNTDPKARQFTSLRRRFDNAAFFVALYAIFESYVEALAAAFASLEARRLPYTELPEKLAAKHLKHSADLLARGRLGEGRHAGLTVGSVVENLYNCLSGVTPYALNEAAVVWHDSNLRARDIDDIFVPLGLEGMCSQVRRGDALIRWHMTVQGLEVTPPDGLPHTVIEERLNDLVERRNQVAHRGGKPANLLGVDGMNETINFIEALSTDLFAMVVGRYLDSRHMVTSAATKLEQVEGDGPFKNGTIIVVLPPEFDLAVGQPIFVAKPSGAARWGRIQSLQLNGAEQETIAVGTPAPDGIGIGLDFACPKIANPFVLLAEDDLVWAPR
ncbi:MAE_28990/MAE_18760 family HEPN-like nuclease [Hydrogenophaga sp. R2]|uniref:MAE_28990/MAE_18760 family HEPN-like nuclease n=1 Tax=Hydrogenophaga sp. R2 TaxID=3132827 RepID=UPI003CE67808